MPSSVTELRQILFTNTSQSGDFVLPGELALAGDFAAPSLPSLAAILSCPGLKFSFSLSPQMSPIGPWKGLLAELGCAELPFVAGLGRGLLPVGASV